MITLIYETRCIKECTLDEEDSEKLIQYAADHAMTIIEAAIVLETMEEISIDPTILPDSLDTKLVAWDES